MLNGRPLDAEAVETILAARGPDGRGVVCDEHGWFLHRRLSIIDPSDESAQPFLGAPHGATALYNGELYNYRELRRELNDLRTNGDTEVFSRLLADSDVSSIRGMYAGVCSTVDEVHLTRDRFGIKPLYVADIRGSITVASQVRCFPKLTGCSNINPDAVASVLRFGSVVGTTMFEDVAEFQPGSTATYRHGKKIAERRLPLPHGGELASALRNSVRRHLVADVPVAVLLSGGLDSAVVGKLAAEEGNEITAVTLSPGGEVDESDRARRTARHYGLNHVVKPVDLAGVGAVLDEFFDAMDQPSIDGLNTFLVSRALRDSGFKVALSGLGADELFGGYSSFRRVHATHAVRWLPRSVLSTVVGRSGGNPTKRDRWLDARRSLAELAAITREVFAPEEVDRLCGSSFEPEPVETGIDDAVIDSEVRRYMTPMLLRDADAFSMAASVELRVPFLDDEVVGAAIKRSSWSRAVRGKSAIAASLRDDYLRTVSREHKTGFRLPFDDWLKGDLRVRLDQALESGSPLSQFVDVAEARALTEQGPWSRRWVLVVVNEWISRHV
ncbi:MAG: asparagine synthase (glutamine-hydrolyzing) [Acidimicrobiia bacterium]|nr:asparagine synthase (glutamine-hydrolyzing) [Acidimicrobiia bacterium]